MKTQAMLIELLDRIATLPDEKVLISGDELKQWPAELFEALKSHKLIRKTRQAGSVVCVECEEECHRPVQTRRAPSGDARVFLVCDKHDDVNIVPVPVERLEQWQTSGVLVAEMLTGLLDLIPSAAQDTSSGRWEVGLLKGKKYSSHLVLMSGDTLSLSLAGHTVPLSTVLTFENNQIKIDKRSLTRSVDQPVTGGGDTESAVARADRLYHRVEEERAKGNRAFNKAVAEEEGFSVQRLKQILDWRKKQKKPIW